MTDNHAHDKELLKTIDALLDDGQTSGNAMLDELAETTPRARSAFQQSLGESLLRRLQESSADEDTTTERGFIHMADKEKRKRNDNERPRRLPYVLAAAVLALVLIGGVFVLLNTSQRETKSATLADDYSVFVMTGTPEAPSDLDPFELTATVVVQQATQTVAIPLTATAVARGAGMTPMPPTVVPLMTATPIPTATFMPTASRDDVPSWDCAAEVTETTPLHETPANENVLTGITSDVPLRVIERTYNGVVRVEAYLSNATYSGWLQEDNIKMVTDCDLEYTALPTVTPGN